MYEDTLGKMLYDCDLDLDVITLLPLLLLTDTNWIEKYGNKINRLDI